MATTESLSAKLAAERDQHVARGVSAAPITIAHAHGARITDLDGREYIDFVGGIGSLNQGHTPEAIVRAVQEQAERFMHTMVSISAYEGYVDICRLMCEHHPGSFATKGMLTNSGAEAVENAVKIARYHTGRPAIVCFDQAFHGRTLLTMSLTSKVMPYKKGMGPFAPEIYRAAAPWPYRGIGTAEALASVRKLFKSQVDAESVAAIIYEPVQGEGGFLPATPGFIEGLAELCSEHGIVFIDDEVQSGMGRVGSVLAVERLAPGVEPDLIVWGKSIGGGLPLAGVSGRAEIMDAPHVGALGGTFTGNPLSCAAGKVAFEMVLDPGFLARAEALGARATERLLELQRRYPLIGEVRGCGPMIGIELVTDPISKEPAAEQTGRIIGLARDRGLLLMGAGIYSNVIRFLFPLVISDQDLEAGFDILESCFAEV